MNMDTEAEIAPNQLLPDDLVLEIVARCGTIGDAIRCAATSKSIRRGILHAPFLRHLRGFLNNGGEHGDDGRPFIPLLLLGLYHQSGDPHLQPSFVPASDGAKLPPSLVALPSPPNHDDSVCDFGPYLPVASRRSLLVLRRRCKSTAKEHLIERHGLHPVELSVCNPTTGERRVLPPHDVQDMSHALLDVDPIVAPSSFKLLVAELSNNNPCTLYVQIFSSDSEEGGGGWGPALACPILSRFRESRFRFGCSDGNTGRPRPVVVGDTVYWLCTSRLGDRILMWRWRGGVAREAWIADPPPGYSLGRREHQCLVVLPSPADAAGAGSQSQSQALLGLIVIEAGEIVVWACEKSGAGSAREWKLWHRIQEETIPRPMDFSSRWLRGAELSWFCEGSGTLFLRPRDGTMSPLLFCLDTMEVSKLDAREWELNPEPEFCPYEVDLLWHMLFVMKQF
jgi:hypothetical protein